MTEDNGKEERSSRKCLVEENANVIRSQHTNARRNSGKTDTRRNSLFLLIIFLLFTISGSSRAESLWTPDFGGYITSTDSSRIGDLVAVNIDSSLKLKFDSASKDSKSLILEFTGGEYGNLLSFLPQIFSRGDRNLSGTENTSLAAVIVTRVTAIDANGFLFISGTKTMSLEGKTQSLTLTGWVSPEDLGKSRQVPFEKVADSRLVFRSLLQPSEDILRPEDIETLFSEAAGAEGTEGGSPEGTTTYSLTDARKRELFLLYVNRLIDIIFR